MNEKRKLGNFEKTLEIFDENSIEKLNLFIFRKFFSKNRAFGNNTIFLQQFFRFRGVGISPLSPWLRPWVLDCKLWIIKSNVNDRKIHLVYKFYSIWPQSQQSLEVLKCLKRRICQFDYLITEIFDIFPKSFDKYEINYIFHMCSWILPRNHGVIHILIYFIMFNRENARNRS